MIVLLTLLMLVDCEHETDKIKRGLCLLNTHGAQASLDYFRKLTLEEDDASSLYYAGWALYANGNRKDAAEVAHFVLPRVEDGGYIWAVCHYLLGNVFTDEGSFDEATEHFQKSAKAISAMNYESSSKMLYKIYASMSNMYIYKRDYKTANQYLDLALAERERLKSRTGEEITLGYVYSLYSRASFGTGDYGSALRYAVDSREAYKNSSQPLQAIRALCSVVFMRFLNGDIENALLDTQAVSEAINQDPSNYAQLSLYNAANWILAKRCSGASFSDLENKLRNHLRLQGDEFLAEHLDFILKWDCGRP